MKSLFGGLLYGSNVVSSAFRELLAKAGLPSVVDGYRDYLANSTSGDYAAFLARSFPYRATRSRSRTTRRTRRLRAMTSLTSGPRSTPSRTSSPREASNRRSRSGFSATGARARPSSWTPCNSDRSARGEQEALETPQNALPFWKQIVQINFNAWHYVKGDLWASLVEQVFSGLRVTRDSDDSELAKRQKHWLDQIEAKRQERRASWASSMQRRPHRATHSASSRRPSTRDGRKSKLAEAQKVARADVLLDSSKEATK